MYENPLLPRLLYWSSLTAAVALLLFVVLAPLFPDRTVAHADWRRILALFARDTALRRVSLASALGLAVTAHIFFRLPSTPRPDVSRD